MNSSALLRKIVQRFIASANVQQYIAHNTSFFVRPKSKTTYVVLINQVHSFPPIELNAQASNYLSHRKRATIEHYRFESEKLDRYGFPHPVLNKIFSSFGSKKGLSWQWYRPDVFCQVWKALKVYWKLPTKQHLLNLKLDGVPIGTLIYDTYLRRYERETLKLRDWRLLSIIIQAFVIFHRSHDYFNNHNVVALFPGDVAYIYSGIIARIAVLRGVPTYSVVESPCRLQKMDSSFYRRVPYWLYRKEFEKLTAKKQEAAKQQAALMIQSRLSGKIDNRMAYMRKSAFTEKSDVIKALRNTDTPKILVLLHDFYDSPHIYRNMLFADFWEWICFTLEHSMKTNYEWYVKGHPNGLPGNTQIINQLKKLFPQIHFLDPRISNRQLIAEGISTVFSVYGSAGHEFPYMGIPVVMAGDNPHIAYDFTYAPQNKQEYKNLIINAGHLKCEIDKEQVHEFYYMHYCHYQSQLPLSPVYPPDDYCKEFGLDGMSSKEQRNYYHKEDVTLAYLLKKRTSNQKQALHYYFKEILGESD